jgi:hypothetical protein
MLLVLDMILQLIILGSEEKGRRNHFSRTLFTKSLMSFRVVASEILGISSFMNLCAESNPVLLDG